MAGSLSDYCENKVLDHIVGKTSFTMPATVALALTTTVPLDAETGSTISEPTSGEWSGYARKTLTPGTDFSAASGGANANAAAITFVGFDSGTGPTILGMVGCDHATKGNGNALWHTDVPSPGKLINASNTPPTVAIGALTLSLT